MASNANTNVDKLLAFGKMALEQGWYDQAREYFEQALALDAANREAMKGLARVDEILLSRKAATAVEPMQIDATSGDSKPSVEPPPQAPLADTSFNTAGCIVSFLITLAIAISAGLVVPVIIWFIGAIILGMVGLDSNETYEGMTLFLRKTPGALLMHPPEFCTKSVQIKGCQQIVET
jgi:hypothetical protein